jgi:hypothetical protein
VSILSLVVVLIASNAWWAYRMLDAGISYTYLSVSLKENEAAVAQLIALAPVLARGATRDEVIAAARQPGDTEAFEKEGFVWVGHIGLQFGSEGRLQKVSRAWSYE